MTAALVITLLSLCLGACEPGTCVRESDCVGQTVCRVGRCVIADDAGPVPDAALFDTGDASTDAASLDAGSDASLDAPVAMDDAALDAATAEDAPIDGAIVEDAAIDGALDAASDDAGA